MKPSNKQDLDNLEHAYTVIYNEKHDCDQEHPDKTHQEWEQDDQSEVKTEQMYKKDENEGEKMDAAIEIKSSEQDMTNQGKKMPRDLNRASQAADKYIDDKVRELSTENIFSDSLIVIDKRTHRAQMIFRDKDVDQAVQSDEFDEVITGLGVTVYMSNEEIFILPAAGETP